MVILGIPGGKKKMFLYIQSESMKNSSQTLIQFLCLVLMNGFLAMVENGLCHWHQNLLRKVKTED